MHFFGRRRASEARHSGFVGRLGFSGVGAQRPRARVAKTLTGLALATLLGATGLSRPVHACSVIANWVEGPCLGTRSRTDGPIPRNAAFLWKGSQQPASEVALAFDPGTQMRIMGHVVRRIVERSRDSVATPTSLFMAKPDELLPLNSDITVSDGRTTTSVTVGDYVDDAAPETPRITSGSIQHIEGPSGCDKEEDSCGSGPWTDLQFTIAEHANDDHTPAERATYAIYLERSAAEARAATMPFVLLRSPMLLSDGSLLHAISVDHDWADADAFISVSALDMAGNESPRTEPYRVNAATNGCAVSLHRRRSSVSVAVLLGLVGLAWARRRKGARAITKIDVQAVTKPSSHHPPSHWAPPRSSPSTHRRPIPTYRKSS
jgi:hypothetical protein